jgi:16S rRNA (guanine527-N7)-methyltransferase
MRSAFIESIRDHQAAFGLSLDEPQTERLAGYFDLVQEHNPLLHLVGPCSPVEFAVRHVLESLALLKHLPEGAKFVDVGTGAGFPSIPCLLVRDDLGGVLIESKIKKARFLDEAISKLGLNARAAVVNKQFSETTPGDRRFITCRALDKFTEKLPGLVKWSGPRTMLFYGGENLGEALKKLRLDVKRELLPMSDQRYLFVIRPS